MELALGGEEGGEGEEAVGPEQDVLAEGQPLVRGRQRCSVYLKLVNK